MLRKLWVRVAIAGVAILLLLIVVVPFFVNADTFRPMIESQLSSSLDRKVSLGHLRFSLITASLNANNISIADDTAFSSSPFLQAKELEVGVEPLALLFKHRLSVTRLTIDDPAIQLIQNRKGTWNFSNIGDPDSSSPASQPAAVAGLSVGELRIKNGSATVSSLPPHGKPFVYSAIDLTVKNLSLASSFPFELSAHLPAGGSVQLKGTAGPLSTAGAADTPFQAALQLKHFDPVASGVIAPSENITMLLDADAKAGSDGKSIASSGTIHATRLHLAAGGAPSPKPVDIDYSTSLDLASRTGTLTDMAVHAGQVAAHIRGGYQLSPDGAILDLRLSAPALPVDQLEELLPAAGVTLPKGSALKGGTLTANLAIRGPASNPVISGPVEVDNTTLAGFDIGSRMQGVSPFGGSGGGTAIRKLSADVTSTAQSTSFANIFADLPQVGTATGNGSISSAQALNFQMLAKFNALTGITSVVSNAINSNQTISTVLGFARGFKKNNTKSNANGAIPIDVAGTASDPKIHVKLGAMF